MKVSELISELEKLSPNEQVKIAIMPNIAYKIGNVIRVKRTIYLTEGDYKEFIPKSVVKQLGWEQRIHPRILEGLSD